MEEEEGGFISIQDIITNAKYKTLSLYEYRIFVYYLLSILDF